MNNQFNNEFIDFMIRYLTKKFSEDTDFANIEFHINEAYDYNNKLSSPQIALQLLENSENERYTSFEKENVSNFGLQLDSFAENMEIGDTVYTAQKSCSIIADKIKQFMNELKFSKYNTNIVRLVRTGRDFTSPIDDGSQVYTTVIRYDCQCVFPYLKELENI